MTPHTSDPLVGQNLSGRYEIMSRLGAGGMGSIYIARQRSEGAMKIDRQVAVKVMADRNADLTRFQAEAEVISQLRHANTLTFFDCGETNGQPYIVTELLSGESLQERLQKGPLSALETLCVVREVCCSLEEAHELGIIHRDIKPGNIFLTQVGDQQGVKVLDFGIAKITQEAELESKQETEPNVVVGTPAYLSPEQAEGKPATYASDLYSLGVVAFECIAGRVPFSGSKIKMLVGHAREPPPPLEDTDDAVAGLITRLLGKDSSLRATSAAALRTQVDALIRRLEADSATVAPPLQPTGGDLSAIAVAPSSTPKQRLVAVSIAAAIGLAVAVVATVLLVRTGRDAEVGQLTFAAFASAGVGERLIAPGSTLRSGARIAFSVAVSAPMHVYVLQRTADSAAVLFPEPGEPNRLRGRKRLPPSGWFQLDTNTGVEQVYLVASRRPLREADNLVAIAVHQFVPGPTGGDQPGTMPLRERGLVRVHDQGVSVAPDHAGIAVYRFAFRHVD